MDDEPIFYEGKDFCLDSLLFTKIVVTPLGAMSWTRMPVELVLGWQWDYRWYHNDVFVAFSKTAGEERHNLFWEGVRTPSRHSRLRGVLVFFRFWKPLPLVLIHRYYEYKMPCFFSDDIFLKLIGAKEHLIRNANEEDAKSDSGFRSYSIAYKDGWLGTSEGGGPKVQRTNKRKALNSTAANLCCSLPRRKRKYSKTNAEKPSTRRKKK